MTTKVEGTDVFIDFESLVFVQYTKSRHGGMFKAYMKDSRSVSIMVTGEQGKAVYDAYIKWHDFKYPKGGGWRI